MGGGGCVGAMGHGGAGGRLTTLENFLWTLVTFSSWPSCRMIQVSWSAVKGLALVIVGFVKSERKFLLLHINLSKSKKINVALGKFISSLKSERKLYNKMSYTS